VLAKAFSWTPGRVGLPPARYRAGGWEEQLLFDWRGDGVTLS